jgi:Holliday junction DNA helicase RuvA
MIALLRGRVIEKHPNRVVVDVQGVGYDVHVPLSSYYEVGEAGADVTLRIHTHVREDALQLFGFLTPLEQELFERLIGISGIGPKLAIAVLSGIETEELVASVRRADIARLTRIPGIGRKTSERIILELKDRLPDITAPDAPTGPPQPADDVRGDLLSALQNLGYHRPLAERAIERVLAGEQRPTFEEALRATLRELMQ